MNVPATAGVMAVESTSMHRTTNASDTSGRIAYRQFGITGLTCAGEAAGLERHLRQRAGVLKVSVNPVTECAYVTYDPTRVDLEALIGVINASGYGTG